MFAFEIWQIALLVCVWGAALLVLFTKGDRLPYAVKIMTFSAVSLMTLFLLVSTMQALQMNETLKGYLAILCLITMAAGSLLSRCGYRRAGTCIEGSGMVIGGGLMMYTLQMDIQQGAVFYFLLHAVFGSLLIYFGWQGIRNSD